MKNKEYEPFGEEWIKEMKKFPKVMLVEFLKNKCIEANYLKGKYNALVQKSAKVTTFTEEIQSTNQL